MSPTFPYCREPLKTEGTIPVFSITDAYIENYNKISSDHLSYYFEDGSNPFMPDEELWVEMESSTVNIVKKHLPENGYILDVGVGMGRLLEQFPKAKRYGMDISSGYLKIAQQKDIETCLALIDDMPYLDNTFDVIVCTDVLEHVVDLNNSLKQIFRVLKDDGVLVVRVPYREELKAYLIPNFPYEYVHLRNFDEFSLTMLFTKIFNCRILEIKTAALNAPAFGTFRGAGRLAQLIRKATSIFPFFISNILRKLFLKPIEINIAVTKHKTD